MPNVSTSAFYERSTLSMTNLRARAESLQASIASGQRLGAGSDDPVAAARLRSLARGESFSTVASAAADTASADLELADTTLGSLADTLGRVKELAMAAANGVLTTGQRSGIATELGQIQGELLRLANARDGAGHALFGGETSGAAYVLDAAGNASYAGTASAGTLSLGDGQSVTRGITGPEAFNLSTPAGPTDLFAIVKTLTDALNGGAADPAQAARDALGGIDRGIDSLTTAQTVVGARLNWIDLTTTRRVQASEQNASEQARIGGTDLAETVTQLQQTMTVLEASQASFAKLSALSLFDLLR